MADPSALAGMSLGGSVIGSGVKAFGDIYSAGASSAAYTYQSAVAMMNAKVAQQNARWAVQTGEVKAQEAGMQGAARLAQTKAIQGASGLNVNTGSGVDVRASEADLTKFNEMTIRSNAAREAYGFKVQAAGDVAQANLDTAAAKQAKTAGYISAASSILGGGTSVADKWLKFGQQGVPGFGGGSSSSSSSEADLYGGE